MVAGTTAASDGTGVGLFCVVGFWGRSSVGVGACVGLGVGPDPTDLSKLTVV